MKNLIVTVLQSGFSTTKKPLADFIKYLYITKYIFHTDSLGRITHNDNPFWKPENRKNRVQLLRDVHSIHRNNVQDSAYYTIINRFENGDKYGIAVEE